MARKFLITGGTGFLGRFKRFAQKEIV